MVVEYINRKGVAYYLCRGQTKTGKDRYYFAREPKPDSPQDVPEGYKIKESVNGKVSLAKDHPEVIALEELVLVENALGLLPEGEDYRLDIKKNQILVYERQGPNVDDLATLFEGIGIPKDKIRKIISEKLDDQTRFSPILRFVLKDRLGREFAVDRWVFLGDFDDWYDTGEYGKLDNLAPRIIPLLGTDDFYDLL